MTGDTIDSRDSGGSGKMFRDRPFFQTPLNPESQIVSLPPEGLVIIMSTPYKGGRHIVLLILRHPLLDFFWVHQNMIPAIWKSFSIGDLDLQGQGQT